MTTYKDAVICQMNLNLADVEDLVKVKHPMIKKAEHYLVYARHVRWNGADGINIADSFTESVYRNYEATIYAQKSVHHGKLLRCFEASHDVPAGSTTYILALSNKEFLQFQNAEYPFDTAREMIDTVYGREVFE